MDNCPDSRNAPFLIKLLEQARDSRLWIDTLEVVATAPLCMRQHMLDLGEEWHGDKWMRHEALKAGK